VGELTLTDTFLLLLLFELLCVSAGFFFRLGWGLAGGD